MNFLLGCLIGIIIFLIIKIKYYQPKYIMQSDRWISINEKPITEEMIDLIVTDGNEVDYIFCIKFNSYGKAIFSYKKNIITHWMPLPQPPKK